MCSRRDLIRRYRLKKGGRDPTSRTRNSQVPKRGYWDHRVKRGGGGKKGRREERKFWMKPMIGLQWISSARLVRLV